MRGYIDMATKNFTVALNEAIDKNSSLLCVGLDPDMRYLEGKDIYSFCKEIIEATIDLVSAYKLNLAFYEYHGSKGYEMVEKIVEFIDGRVPVIGDAKRNDIGNSSSFYAKGVFETFGFDAMVVNPYLGKDSLDPFFEYSDKGIFVLCKTSNPGGGEFQNLNVILDDKIMPLYQVVALKAQSWNENQNVGLVVGATYPEELEKIREICPALPILMPGIGAQGGNLELSVQASLDGNGRGVIVNASRGVLYSSQGSDFAEAARKSANDLRLKIESSRSNL
jgi:orotidine-5'-phosphate decarboxylase